MTINVAAVNDAPTAAADEYTTDENTVLTVAATGVLANDIDPDGDTLSAILVTGPTSGTLTLNADGSFTYTPNTDFSGTDSFVYKANDGALRERGDGDDHGERHFRSAGCRGRCVFHRRGRAADCRCGNGRLGERLRSRRAAR